MALKLDISMPSDITLQSTYSIRVTALDASTGALVSGVNIGKTVLTVDSGSVIESGDLSSGDFRLIAGPAA